MRKSIGLLLVTLLVLSVTLLGCGGDHNSTTVVTQVTQILSDPSLDGDIEKTSPTTFTVAQGNTESVSAGIVPGTAPEIRAFLDFPLSTVPLNAGIVSANLVIFINSIQATTGSISMRIELVPFSLLSGADFDSAPLVSTPIIFSVFQTDANNYVKVDVTSLMAQAQSLSLSNFQIRILLDFSETSGFIVINDTTGPNRAVLAPLLEVEFL